MTTPNQEEQGGDGLPLSCQCGHISLTTPPLSLFRGLYHCHCTLCQKQSGSAFGTSLYFPSTSVFPLPKELEAKLSLYKHSDSESGNTMLNYFCPRCGVRIMHFGYLKTGEMREMMSFKGGLVDERKLDWAECKGKHIWTKSAVMPLVKEWECYERYPPVQVKEEEKKKEEVGDGNGDKTK
ncbi:Mss4-like protein [Cladorrhinum sp. PSN259]|nr:Mss4-like protein [Cladorrhinum sp. PSN259]